MVLLRDIVAHPGFALLDLLFVATSASLWIIDPDIGPWVILIAALPWVLRLSAGVFPFKRTPLDWLVGIYLLTGWVGYWAAYDKEVAWSKVWLIVLAVFLYYALANQPRENLDWVCAFLFCIGVGVSIYFLLTYDFIAFPRKVDIVNRVGRTLMGLQPQVTWSSIHPNYAAGIAALTTPFILYPVDRLIKRPDRLSAAFLFWIAIGTTMTLAAILMATSRGVVMAIAAAFGVWILWKVLEYNCSKWDLSSRVVFPLVVTVYLIAVAVYLYAGPGNSGSVFTDVYYYGTGSRTELLTRSMQLALDFPFTGGGLGSFPGLYSYYMLGIPFFNVINSHNLFLDAAIEQGWLGGILFLLMYLVSIWVVAREIADPHTPGARRLAWLILISLILAVVHGMVDDYLYNGSGTVLSLMLPGLTMTSQPGKIRFDLRILSVSFLVAATLLVLNLNKVRAAWYADLGAVRAARVELAGFPTNKWTDVSVLPQLEPAEDLFQAALRANLASQTANHRLGLINMLRRDFSSAIMYFQYASLAAPDHRGIQKSLGYCYVWSGDMTRALKMLNRIPEASSELDVYVWWWGTEGREDLAERSSQAIEQLRFQSNQP